MADFTTIRAAIKTRLETIVGLRVLDYLPDDVTPPAAIVMPERGAFIIYDTSFDSLDMSFFIILLVSKASDRTSQLVLDSYLNKTGTKSIAAAVNGNLGNAVHYATVTQVRAYGMQWVGNIQYFGCEFVIHIGAQ